MLMTERRFPAASPAQRAVAYTAGGSEWEVREASLDHEIQRCREMIQASKAERLYQSTPDSRRGH